MEVGAIDDVFSSVLLAGKKQRLFLASLPFRLRSPLGFYGFSLVKNELSFQ
jgi:hypothetical protein